MSSPVSITFGPGEFTQREREGLSWLLQRGEWVTAAVTRKSLREFDLNLDGTRWLNRQAGSTCASSAWFVKACIAEFWEMDLIENEMNDWSFLRDRPNDVQWEDFEAILNGNQPTGQLAEMGATISFAPASEQPRG